MKKIFFISILLLFINTQVKADINMPPVQINLIKNFYSDISKTYNNGITTIEYTNNLLSMDLTDNQLKLILSQKSGNGSSRLTYYETLNILVTPVEGTPYESLKEKSTFYRANNGGSWISNTSSFNPEMNNTAEIYNLNNNFWPWGFKMAYRLSTEDAFTSTVPNGMDLTNKTLEQQLATIFDIDLDTNPNGVVDLYPEQLTFKPLPSGYTFGIRFDFLDKKTILIQLKQKQMESMMLHH